MTKSLYGLKQASRQWFAKLPLSLTYVGFTKSKSYHSLFIKKTSTTFTTLLVYVDDEDDIILADDSLTETKRIKYFLDNTFKINDLGELKYYFYLEVA